MKRIILILLCFMVLLCGCSENSLAGKLFGVGNDNNEAPANTSNATATEQSARSIPHDKNAVVGVPNPEEHMYYTVIDAGGESVGLVGTIFRQNDNSVKLYLTNFKENKAFIMCEIVNAETNTIIYRSGLLRPGEYVERLNPLVDIENVATKIHINVYTVKTDGFTVIDTIQIGNTLQPNHSTPPTNDAWKELYTQFILDEAPKRDFYGWSTYSLIYIDNDDVPELVIDWGVTAEGGSLIIVSNSELVTFDIVSEFDINYIERENLFMISGGRMGDYYEYLYRIEGKNAITLHSGEWSDRYIEDDEWYYGIEEYHWYWNGDEVSRAEYERQLKAVFNRESAKSNWDKTYDLSEIFDVIKNW
jgi:hypothetical protein